VNNDGGDFIEAVKYKTVSPSNDGDGDRSGAQSEGKLRMRRAKIHIRHILCEKQVEFHVAWSGRSLKSL
jgi:hypothetical protein